MSRYILIHRLTGPAILLLLGMVALLREARIVSWNIFFPLLLILIGAIKLAERAAMANEPYPPPFPGADPYYQGQPYGAPQGTGQNTGQAGATGTAIVPASHDFGGDPNGGRS